MQEKAPIFKNLRNTDAALAQEIAERALIPLPAPCISGVAANARLIQHHLDTLRGPDLDGR